MTKLIATIAAVLITAPSSFAGIQEFEDEERPLWFDAVGAGNYVTIDFYEFPENTTLTNEYKPWGVTFSGLNFVSPSILDPDGSVLRIIDGNDIYFSEPINWVAADISGAITIELFVGDTKFFTSQSFGAGPTPHFGGLISEQAFDHIRIYDRFDNVANLHDFYFGPPIAVPAPGAIALTPLILLFRRRRR